MSEENFNVNNDQRDAMDGGFAVVDREKIIEEETRVITPWYMHFINVFCAPRKMMEENFYHEPPKGISVGIVGTILFTIIMLILTYANPLIKEQMYDAFRMQGMGEELLAQRYVMTQLGIIIGGIIMVFIIALITATVIQIVKLIVKDKGRFGSIYTAVLLSTMVSSAITCIDRLIGMFIPTANIVLGLPILLPEDIMMTNMPLAVVSQVLTIPSIAGIIILIIGYSVLTRASIKKSIGVILSVQVFFTLVGIGIAYAGQAFAQNMMGAM